MTTNDKEKLFKIVDEDNFYETGSELKRLLNEYFEDDKIVGDRPELLSLFGQRENIDEPVKLIDTIQDNKEYTLEVDVVREGLFLGTKTCFLKRKD